MLVVSHDRAFLDATVSRVLYLDPETRTVRSYRGAYSDFAAARAHERRLHEDAWRQQQDHVERVQSDVSRLKSQARSIEQSTTARQPGLRKFARKKAAVATSRQRKLERYLESDERVERPRLRWPINLDFGARRLVGGRCLRSRTSVSVTQARRCCLSTSASRCATDKDWPWLVRMARARRPCCVSSKRAISGRAATLGWGRVGCSGR